jgi:hypothetical protein
MDDIKVFTVLISVIYTLDKTPYLVGVPVSLIFIYWYMLSSNRCQIYLNKSIESVDYRVKSVTPSKYWYFLQPVWYLLLTLIVSFFVLY